MGPMPLPSKLSREEYERKLVARSSFVVGIITNKELLDLRAKLVSGNQKLRDIDQQINRSVDFQISLDGSYRGQMNDYYRQGYGELISDDQSGYRLGQWKNDKIDGYGLSIYLFEDYFEYYIGTFLNGKAHGKGKLTKKDGSYYDGDWISGEPEGRGYIFISGYSTYVGQVQKGRMHGNGQWTLQNQEKIVKCSGIFVEDQMINGQIQGPQGNYFGELVNGNMHGKGRFIWNDGSYYSGDFKDNQRDGFGVSKYEINNENEKNGTHKWQKDKQIEEVPV